MTMLSILERDKEKLITNLQTAGTPDQAVKVITDEVDRLLLIYNEDCNLPARREAAADMLQATRLSASLVDTMGDVKVWERTIGDGDSGSKIPFFAKLMLGAGALCLLGGLWIAIFANPEAFRPTDLLLAAILVLGGGFLMWFSGKRCSAGSRPAGSHKRKSTVTGPTGSGKEYAAGNGLTGSATQKIETRVDARRIYTTLHNTIYAIDRNLEQLQPGGGYGADSSAQNGQGSAVSGFGSGANGHKLSPAEVELMAGLLEAAGSGDGNYALQKIADVKYFLHQHQIEAVDYNGSNAEWFDFMPARQKRTIRPALVCEGKVIKRGVAAGSR